MSGSKAKQKEELMEKLDFALVNGDIDESMELLEKLKQAKLPITKSDRFDRFQLTTYATENFDSLIIINKLIEMGLKATPQDLLQQLKFDIEHITPKIKRKLLRRLKFILYLLTQPKVDWDIAPYFGTVASGEVSVDDPIIVEYLANPENHVHLKDILGEINTYVPLQSPEARPLLELLGNAITDKRALNQLIFHAMRSGNIFTFRRPLLTPYTLVRRLDTHEGGKRARRRTRRRK